MIFLSIWRIHYELTMNLLSIARIYQEFTIFFGNSLSVSRKYLNTIIDFMEISIVSDFYKVFSSFHFDSCEFYRVISF